MAQRMMNQQEAKSHLNMNQQSGVFQVIQGIAKAGLVDSMALHVLTRRAPFSKPAAQQGLLMT